ncbi:MAG: ribonuclease P protein component [Oscillospiraceae bacterium]|jgi:ribonuclease P protein component|nr:ribonuclease P protein component [Oscillospiraceae bacterium]
MAGKFWQEGDSKAEKDFRIEKNGNLSGCSGVFVGKTEILNENKQFRRVYYRGKSIVLPVLVIYMLKNGLNQNRLGITTSKKIGKAATRNRAKRVIKAAFTDVATSLPVGFDFVLVARGRTAKEKSTYIKQVIQRGIKVLMKG